MVEKKLKKPEKTTDVMHLVNKKVEFFKDVIQKTVLHIQRNKSLNILFQIFDVFKRKLI